MRAVCNTLIVMHNNTARFVLPKKLKTTEDKLDFVLKINEKLRSDALPLRQQNKSLQITLATKHKKIHRLEQENDKLISDLKKAHKEIKSLKDEVHKKVKTTNRYRISLLAAH